MADKEEVANQAAAVSGAQAVADAVKRVADAAVSAASKAPIGEKPELIVSAVAGGRFVIRGENLGTNGVVTFGGQPVTVRGWGGTRIEGEVPAGTPHGEVVVHIDDKTQKRGYFR